MNSTVKKSFSLVLLGSLLLSGFAWSPIGAMQESGIRKMSPEKTLIAVDFHEVLAQFNMGYEFCDSNGNTHLGLGGQLTKYGLGFAISSFIGAMGWAGTYPRPCTLSQALLAGPTILTTALSTVALLSMYKMLGKKERLEQAYGSGLLSYLKPEMMQLASMYIPDEKVFDQIKKLKDANYTIVLASNIGPESLDIIKKRYPEYFEVFADYFIPCDDTQWISKKQPEKYFGNLLTLAKDKFGKEKILFIDDSAKNCKNAQACGDGNIDTIHFKMPSLNPHYARNGMGVWLGDQLTKRGAFDYQKA